MTDPKSVAVGGAYINDFRRYPELKTAKDRFVVTPNNVTVDAYATLDLTAEPVVVFVPALAEPRWYIVQIGDSFDEIVRNIGGTKGAQPGVYVITGPDFAGTVPGDMTEVRMPHQDRRDGGAHPGQGRGRPAQGRGGPEGFPPDAAFRLPARGLGAQAAGRAAPDGGLRQQGSGGDPLLRRARACHEPEAAGIGRLRGHAGCLVSPDRAERRQRLRVADAG